MGGDCCVVRVGAAIGSSHSYAARSMTTSGAAKLQAMHDEAEYRNCECCGRRFYSMAGMRVCARSWVCLDRGANRIRECVRAGQLPFQRNFPNIKARQDRRAYYRCVEAIELAGQREARYQAMLRQQAQRRIRRAFQPGSLYSLDKPMPDGGSRERYFPGASSAEDQYLAGVEERRQGYFDDLLHVVEYQRKARELGRDPRHYVAERMGVALERVLKMEADIDHLRRGLDSASIDPNGEVVSIELDDRRLERVA